VKYQSEHRKISPFLALRSNSQWRYKTHRYSVRYSG